MKSKQPSIRALGQRSIPSTFVFRSTNRPTYREVKEEIGASNEKGSGVSLSEFLNKKLQRSSVLPGSFQGKDKPFVSPFRGEILSNCAKGETADKNGGESRTEFGLDIVLQQFKDSKEDQNNVCSSANIELGSGSTNDKEEPKKRMRGDDKENSGKILAVLGDDSEPKRRRKDKIQRSHEDSLPVYNHYANGGGWWDYEMEGVDNEEVGSTEVWEGMGSTTLGGIDWH